LQKYCAETWKRVVEMLGGDIDFGLTSKEYENRKKLFGNNKIHLPSEKNGIKAFIKAFLRIYFLILIATLAVAIYKEDYFTAIILSVVIAITIIIKIYYLHNIQKEVFYLQKLNNIVVTVLRDGKLMQVKSEELVRGDIVKFKKESLIPADLRIISANKLKVDEKNITGENFYKDKYENIVEGSVLNLGEMNNILFKGTLVKSGEGTGIVVETGDETQLGKMLAMIVYAKNKHVIGDKLEKSFSKIMLFASIIICIFSAILYYSFNQMDNLLLSLAVAVSFPVGILVLLQSILLKKYCKNKGIELNNISTLDVIQDIEYLFLDKIGSISKEEVFVRKIYSNDNIYSEEDIDYDNDINIQRIVDIVLLSNDALYNVEKDTGSGDLIEVGYLRFAAKKRAYKAMVNNKYKRIFEIPMESDKRVLTTVNKYNKGYRANVRGNVDAVIEKCKYIMEDGIEKEISQEDIEKIRAIDYNFSVDGLISQGIAYRSFSYQPSLSENIESNLVFVGIIALENPLNQRIEKDLEIIKRKGITPIIFTEDNKIAAYALGKKAGLIENTAGVISGVEMGSMTKEEFTSTLARVRVFARVTPEIKGKIVGMFVKEEYEVAASGESLGDSPILSIAKIGIGKGTASEIVKSLSDIFIKENYLKGFLKLFDISRNFKNGIQLEKGFLIALMVSEIIIVNILQLIDLNKSLSLLVMLLINTVIFIPLSLILLNSKKQAASDNKSIIRTVLWTTFTLVGVYDIENGCNEMAFLLLSNILIVSTAIASNISFKKYSTELMLLILAILFMLVSSGILIIANSLSFSYFAIIKSIIILIIYGAIEFFIRKWQG
jgi:magnesium-transporting ATPase (P-type)